MPVYRRDLRMRSLESLLREYFRRCHDKDYRGSGFEQASIEDVIDAIAYRINKAEKAARR